ncbi:MAG: pseudouridine synthase [Clostridia bacterium]|nr:pseudouridine synthase [Clostridia bacterium]
MLYYMMNKPAGYLTACSDELRPTVMEFIPEEYRSSLKPIGRLDMDTTGLLLFTDDGRVTPALMQPKSHVEKKYFFYAIGKIDAAKKRSLEQGVRLGSSGEISLPAVFGKIWEGTVGDISSFLPERRKMKYLKNPSGPAFAGTLTVREGKKHQIKLMLRAVDCKIIRLSRVSLGGITLDLSLKAGEGRFLYGEELNIISELIERGAAKTSEVKPDFSKA